MWSRPNSSIAGKFFVLLLVLASARIARPQSVEQNQAILNRLDQLEKQNGQLLKEIKALREDLLNRDRIHPDQSAANEKVAPDAAAKPDQPLTESQEVNEHRIEELAQTRLEASQHFPIQLTGMALFNAFSNGRNGGTAQDPTVASVGVGVSNAGASFRQTVLGLKFQGPQTLLGGAVSGSIYMDFFGGSAASLSHLLRLRLATVQVDWPNTTFAVGQDKPLVSRREPNSLAQVGVSPLTDAGNPWLWQPQARIEQRIRLSPQTEIKAEGGIFQTAEPAGLRPAFESRVSIAHRFNENQSLEIAPVFHTSTTHQAGLSVPSRLYGIDWFIQPAAKLQITGLFFKGKNFANLGALGGLTLLSTAQAIAVHGTGGWLQFRYLATQRLSFNTYGGQQDDRNRDLVSGQIGKNQYYAANTMYLLAPNVMAAFESGQNRTTYLGLGNRLNNHYDLALAYLF